MTVSVTLLIDNQSLTSLVAFRTLVEENVKSNVEKIANSQVIRDVCRIFSCNFGVISCHFQHHADLIKSKETGEQITEIFIHGWVYDVETGKVLDLDVSVGPPGFEVPFSPFPKIRT